MTADPPRPSVTRSRHPLPRPFLLTSALGRVALAVGLSLALWVMTAWALGWFES